jgi:hypothetical protein
LLVGNLPLTFQGILGDFFRLNGFFSGSSFGIRGGFGKLSLLDRLGPQLFPGSTRSRASSPSSASDG